MYKREKYNKKIFTFVRFLGYKSPVVEPDNTSLQIKSMKLLIGRNILNYNYE